MSQPLPAHITMIGCGNMGGALLQNWLDHTDSTKFHIITPHSHPPAHPRVTHAKEITADIKGSAIVIIATKPQILPEICAEITKHLPADALVISIAAGQSLNAITQHLGNAQQPIIRIMPNTPAAIGKGMSAAVKNTYATNTHASWAQELMTQSGEYVWLEDESLMDAATALCGSGPAYIFYMIEALTQAGAQNGLPLDIATKMARQTVIGAAALAEQSTEIAASQLRKNVTSKGGTTEAGLNVLMDGRLQDTLKETIKAATTRGKKLNS